MMDKLEKIRLKLKNYYIGFGILVLLTLCIGVFVIGLILETFYIIMVEIVIAASFIYTENKQYKMIFKKIFVEENLKNIFDDFCYDPNKGISYEVIASTNMMYMGDRYSSNDYVSGKYKGINFEQSDVHIEQMCTSYDNDGNADVSYVTIFKGRWLIFEFNKNFKARLQICQKGFGNSKVQLFFVGKDKKFKQVKMESEKFNNDFKVYAQSEYEAFYLITPAFMERIEKLCENNYGKFLFCFVDQKLHVGIQNGKDLFEPTSIFRKLDVDKVKQDVLKDIRLITQFVDDLKLDNNLFKVGV